MGNLVFYNDETNAGNQACTIDLTIEILHALPELKPCSCLVKLSHF